MYLPRMDFSTTQVDAGEGDDAATLNGAAGESDRLIWTPDSVEFKTLRGNGSISTTVKGVESINAVGGETIDSAELFGSDGDDQLIALPEVVQLTTPLGSVMAHEFGFVISHGGEGHDTAHLEDSPFNDSYFSKPSHAYLLGPGYLNLVTQFDENRCRCD